jgi:hypothetical protein
MEPFKVSDRVRHRTSRHLVGTITDSPSFRYLVQWHRPEIYRADEVELISQPGDAPRGGLQP